MAPTLSAKRRNAPQCGNARRLGHLNLLRQIKRQKANIKRQKWDSEAEPFLNFLTKCRPFALCLLPFAF
jgi:hypothetical protein